MLRQPNQSIEVHIDIHNMDACLPLLIRIDLNQLIDKTWEEMS